MRIIIILININQPPIIPPRPLLGKRGKDEHNSSTAIEVTPFARIPSVVTAFSFVSGVLASQALRASQPLFFECIPVKLRWSRGFLRLARLPTRRYRFFNIIHLQMQITPPAASHSYKRTSTAVLPVISYS
jgi:hypothetical protein